MSHFITSAGLEFDVRFPRHGNDPAHHDDPYVMSQAVQVVTGSPSYRGLYPRDRRAVEEALRESWANPLNDRLVAVLHDDPSIIVGFAWGNRSAASLDYLHVRGSFRGQGLGRMLALLMGISPAVSAAVRFDTNDLSRPASDGPFPIGLLHNTNWNLALIPRVDPDRLSPPRGGRT